MARTTIIVELDDDLFAELKTEAARRMVSVETLASYWFEQWWNRRAASLAEDGRQWQAADDDVHAAADRAEQAAEPGHAADPACWCPDCLRSTDTQERHEPRAAEPTDESQVRQATAAGLIERAARVLDRAAAVLAAAADPAPAPDAEPTGQIPPAGDMGQGLPSATETPDADPEH